MNISCVLNDPLLFFVVCCTVVRIEQRKMTNAVIDCRHPDISHQCCVDRSVTLTNTVFHSFIFLYFHHSALCFVQHKPTNAVCECKLPTFQPAQVTTAVTVYLQFSYFKDKHILVELCNCIEKFDSCYKMLSVVVCRLRRVHCDKTAEARITRFPLQSIE